MTNHTPGPWSRNIKPATKYPTVYAGRNTHVAYLSVSGLPPETVEANICLIAAAPELLEALHDINILMDALNISNIGLIAASAHQIVRAAIAKAEGTND